MRFVLLPALILLAACSSAGAKEEEKYRMVERQNATYPEKYRAKELCAQGQAVAQAYLDERDEEHFKMWKLRADIQCNLASI